MKARALLTSLVILALSHAAYCCGPPTKTMFVTYGGLEYVHDGGDSEIDVWTVGTWSAKLLDEEGEEVWYNDKFLDLVDWSVNNASYEEKTRAGSIVLQYDIPWGMTKTVSACASVANYIPNPYRQYPRYQGEGCQPNFAQWKIDGTLKSILALIWKILGLLSGT